jgi:hypothetical protein
LIVVEAVIVALGHRFLLEGGEEKRFNKPGTTHGTASIL